LAAVHERAIERARARLSVAEPHVDRPAEAALERVRAQAEALAHAGAELQEVLPARVSEAISEGVRAEAASVARQLAETRGLSAQAIRRLERLEGELTAERHARVDDLELLVDLIASGWRALAARLDRLERSPAAQDDAAAYGPNENGAGETV
jgi:uncharacterized membrane protein YqiK